MADPQPHQLVEDNIKSVIRMEMTNLERRTASEKIGDAITRWACSPWFIMLQVVFIGVWMAVNRGKDSLDPFPYFLLTLVIAIEALFLSIFVLANQSRMRRASWRREHLGLQVGLLTEQELTAMLRLLHRVARRVGVDEAQPEAEALAAETDLRRVMHKLDEALPE